MNAKPLIVIIEETRIKTCRAINQIVTDSGLPAYLMEGIVEGVLADIRSQKCVEIVQANNEDQKDDECNETPEEVVNDG